MGRGGGVCFLGGGEYHPLHARIASGLWLPGMSPIDQACLLPPSPPPGSYCWVAAKELRLGYLNLGMYW